MFVRKKKNRSGSISIQIIQKVNRVNKVIKTIGSSKDPDEINRLYQKGYYELPDYSELLCSMRFKSLKLVS
jgi:hypothetical protein